VAVRLLLALAALYGALGVSGSAASAHLGGPMLATASQFALFHAPAIIATVVLARLGLAHARLALAAGWLMGLGVLLFSGAVSLASVDLRPIPMAAPTGGTVLILAWLVLAAAALAAPRQQG
jgi:uncharacterized membrane protein YgdD (TMEM256/DUF423 family)